MAFLTKLITVKNCGVRLKRSCVSIFHKVDELVKIPGTPPSSLVH